MLTQKLTLVEWCDQQVADGKELKIKWDGGNDSGWVHFEIDGEDIENEYTEFLVNYMNDHLDYGSWAGDFEASGEAIYDADEKAFVGDDYYSEIDSDSREVNIKIEVPKHLWFNQLFIGLEINNDADAEATVEFNLTNGFFTDEHSLTEEAIGKVVEEKLTDEIDKFIQDYEFDSIWESLVLRPEEAVIEGDNLVFTIENINFRYRNTEDKYVHLDVQEISEKF